jgi:hypothetical protein
MGACISFNRVDVELISDETHDLVKKPTGTLVFAAKIPAGKENIRRASLDHIKGIQATFYGLNIKYSDIIVGQEIGRGSFGAVYKGQYKGVEVAVKQLFVPTNSKEKAELLSDFRRECEILNLLKHPNIVHFMGAVNEDPTFCFLTVSISSPYLFIIATQKTISNTHTISTLSTIF